MPKKSVQERKTEPGWAVEVKEAQIPRWISELAHPTDPPIHVALSFARGQPGWLEHPEWRGFFTALLAVGESRIGRPPLSPEAAADLVTLLDLVPAILVRDPPRWILDGLHFLFAYRLHGLFEDLAESLGKRGSDQNLLILRIHEYYSSARLPPSEVIERLRSAFPEVTEEAIRKAIERGRKNPFA